MDDEQDAGDRGTGSSTVAAVADAVEDAPWLERVAQAGWVARGVVYLLMGFTAVEIARQSAPSDDASPQGSIARLGEAPFGRILLAALTVGLALFVVWRVLTIITIRGNGAIEWLQRIGYAFSAVLYVTLAWAAGRVVVQGVEPGDSNTVEQVSRAVLGATGGRVLLGVAGLATIGVGIWFLVEQGIRRRFVDDLDGVNAHPGDNEPGRATVVAAGLIGWIGRGLVTMLVGYFVLRAAIRFDPDDARGFDRSLRQAAGTTIGTLLVLACAVGLIAYGVFCLASHRFRSLDD